jgi:hypothetical protein
MPLILLLLGWGHGWHLHQLLLCPLLPRGAPGAAALTGKLVGAAAHDNEQCSAHQQQIQQEVNRRSRGRTLSLQVTTSPWSNQYTHSTTPYLMCHV